MDKRTSWKCNFWMLIQFRMGSVLVPPSWALCTVGTWCISTCTTNTSICCEELRGVILFLKYILLTLMHTFLLSNCPDPSALQLPLPHLTFNGLQETALSAVCESLKVNHTRLSTNRTSTTEPTAPMASCTALSVSSSNTESASTPFGKLHTCNTHTSRKDYEKLA